MAVFETLTHLADAVWQAHEPNIGYLAAQQYLVDPHSAPDEPNPSSDLDEDSIPF